MKVAIAADHAGFALKERANPASSEGEARPTREHNDANVLALGARYLGEGRALSMVHLFLDTEFAGGRHACRVAKIARLEQDR